jgi:hypothetical protein
MLKGKTPSSGSLSDPLTETETLAQPHFGSKLVLFLPTLAACKWPFKSNDLRYLLSSWVSLLQPTFQFLNYIHYKIQSINYFVIKNSYYFIYSLPELD